MTGIVLYSGRLSMFGAKAEIAAREKRIAVDLITVPFDMDRLYEPKHPEVLRINPKRQVPVLVHGEVEIFDSTQIFEYFEELKPEPPLWGRDLAGRARARKLELMSDEVYFPHVIRLMGLQQSLSEPAAIAALAGATQFYERFEAEIGEGEWLAGPYTFADIAFFMAQLFGERMGARLPETAPRLQAWRRRMLQRPPVRQVAGAMASYLTSVGRKVPDYLNEGLSSPLSALPRIADCPSVRQRSGA